MAHFHFSLFQHSKLGKATLEDVVDTLIWMIVDLGHTVSRFDGVDKGFLVGDNCYNIVFESFGEQSGPSTARQIDAGAKVICIVTENPTRNTWNNIKTGFYAERWGHFKRLAPRFHALWCLVPGAADKLRYMNRNGVDIELGYSAIREKKFLDIPAVQAFNNSGTKPLYDFGFFGGLTERRRRTFDRMREQGCNIHMLSKGITAEFLKDFDAALMADYVDPAKRNGAMLNCKVILHPAAHHKWGIVSNSRCVTALHLGKPVVCEPTMPSIWQKIVAFSSGFDQPFIDLCKDVLNRWEQEREEQLARFRELLPSCVAIGHAMSALGEPVQIIPKEPQVRELMDAV